MSVQSFNNLPNLARTLNRAAQTWVNQQAGRLKDDLVDAVPNRALAAPAIREGFYLRTPGESGYSDAVSAVRALFERPETLFPSNVMELFAGSGSMFAPDAQQVFNPRIVAEVEPPSALSATIGNCTGWATQAEYGEVGAPFVIRTVNEFVPDTESFEDIWRRGS
jgi:hypothetical protein